MTPKATPAITTLRRIMTSPSFATNPAVGRLCSLFAKLPSTFRVPRRLLISFTISCHKYLRAFGLDLSSNGAVLYEARRAAEAAMRKRRM
jgi:hypothetical protein